MAQLQTPCAGSACGFQQLTPEQAETLKGIGLFPGVYTAFTLALGTLATMVVCLVISTVIVLRRSDDRMALLVALMLVTAGPFAATISVSARRRSLWSFNCTATGGCPVPCSASRPNGWSSVSRCRSLSM